MLLSCAIIYVALLWCSGLSALIRRSPVTLQTTGSALMLIKTRGETSNGEKQNTTSQSR